MTTLNIREEFEETTAIEFGVCAEYVRKNGVFLEINDPSDNTRVFINFDDIDYLIKALEKAKELWT